MDGEGLTKDDVLDFINEYINPGLEMHGGYIEVESCDFESGILRIRMGGGCHGCASSVATMKMMVEKAIMEEFPDISIVEDVTNHAVGSNPYYV